MNIHGEEDSSTLTGFGRNWLPPSWVTLRGSRLQEEVTADVVGMTTEWGIRNGDVTELLQSPDKKFNKMRSSLLVNEQRKWFLRWKLVLVWSEHFVAYVRRIVGSFVSTSSGTWMLEGQQADLTGACCLNQEESMWCSFFLSFSVHCTAWGILISPTRVEPGPSVVKAKES